MMSRRSGATAVLLVLATWACSSKELTRKKAQALIGAEKAFAAPATALQVLDCTATLKVAQKDGLVTISTTTTSPRMLGSMRQDVVELTPEGRKHFKKFSCDVFLGQPEAELVTPLRRTVVDVTGISDLMGGGPGVKQVDYTWKYLDVPDVIARYTHAGAVREARAMVHLYDDGWRVEDPWAGELVHDR